MKNKGLIILVAILVIGIIAVLFLQQMSKTRQADAAQLQANNEAMLAMQYMNMNQNNQNPDGTQKAGVNDWLNTVSSIGGAVSSIFGSGVFSGGNNGE